MPSLTKVEIEKLIKQQLDEMVSLGYYPKVGGELEFYLERDEENIEDFEKELLQHCSRLESEKGWHQLEAVLDHNMPVLQVANKFQDLRYALSQLARKYGWEVDFRAKPHEDDYGSALHLHISLHDRYGFNYYSENTVENNELLMWSVGGLLSVVRDSVALLCINQEDYARFSPKFMAPTNVSWGINNRTTVLRIPHSEAKFRRIEFRLPPANACPFTAMYILLYGVLYGIKNKLRPAAQTWGNAYDDQYELSRLPQSLAEAEELLAASPFFSEFK